MIDVNKLWAAMPRDVQRKISLHDLRRIVENLDADATPKTPPPGLLMSMAIRSDHALGCPGYYDQPMFQGLGALTHAQKLKATISRMSQLWEEVVGLGFYSPGAEEAYVAQYQANLIEEEVVKLIPRPPFPATMEEPP